MEPQKFEYFFDLPPELREQILCHICIFPSGILVGGGDDVNRSGNVALRGGDPALSATVTATAAATPAAVQNGDGDDGGHETVAANPPVNVFLASPILYREAGDLYYGRNVFHFDLASWSWAASWGSRRVKRMQRLQRRREEQQQGWTTTAAAGGLDLFGEGGENGGGDDNMGTMMRLLMQPATAGARRRIRSAAVYVKRFGALMLDVLVPALKDMVLNGALARVRVDVLKAGGGPLEVLRGRSGPGSAAMGLVTASYAGNPALRALLVLLADPDLDRAELRVPRGMHARFWCPFHEGGDSDESCGMSGRRDDGFLQVDIHRLVATCAGDAAEFNITKVGFGSSRPR